jgi:hypothetical protein
MVEASANARATNEVIKTFLQKLDKIEEHLDGMTTRLPTATSISGPTPSRPPLVTTPSSVPPTLRLKLGVPKDLDGERTKGCAFLTSCHLFFSVANANFPNDQTRIHWALSFLKKGRAAMFAERIIHQEAAYMGCVRDSLLSATSASRMSQQWLS